MKRSGQVALVLMGVTATTATAAYMMPPRPECRAQPAASTTAAPAAAVNPGARAAAPGEPCRRRSWHSSGSRGHWGDWSWRTDSHSERAARRSTSLSTALTPPSQGGRVGLVSSGGSSSTSSGSSPSASAGGPRGGSFSSSSSASRGGFGGTGHGMSGGS